jgi:hypothetical protein
MTVPRFWIVTHRRGENNFGVVVGFWSADVLARYMDFPHFGLSTIHLISEKAELILLIGDLHRAGVQQITFDPEPDGSGGEPTRLGDLLHRTLENGTRAAPDSTG